MLLQLSNFLPFILKSQDKSKVIQLSHFYLQYQINSSQVNKHSPLNCHSYW